MNSLYCNKQMTKQEQLELIYSDFLDMTIGKYVFYTPNKCVLRFDKTGYLFPILKEQDITEKMLKSFNICKYTFSDRTTQAIKLSKRFIRSLPRLNFSDFKQSLN